ncbi:peptidylprolyl isomerase [Aliirhizobium terrae]|uniref:peptidylprolyl isomerase n=1 Tax=Terrirhizobium terrae TaxID=2926709 RepID=UPI00257723F7|nr:peptidylprolyl isomerase [Rhizobium sp. CC-CFT758]WJH41189.1 peptidylprolyl isomerase [Rhizobium sp. CC-CFT758]
MSTSPSDYHQNIAKPADKNAGNRRRRYVSGAALGLVLLGAGVAAVPVIKASPQFQTLMPKASDLLPVTSAEAAEVDDVVARVGDKDVSISEVRAFLGGLTPQEQSALARDPALLSQTLRMILANQLVLKEANGKNWQNEPAVKAQLEQVRDAAIVETYLQSVSRPPEAYPAEAELRSAYEANKTAFLVPRQYRLAQIFVASGTDEATRKAASAKLAEIKSKLGKPGADFAKIAAEASDQKETAAQGGELGWLAESQVRPEIPSRVTGLGPNEVSEPVQLDDGWHILRLLETKPAETLPMDSVRQVLVQQLRAQRADQLKRAYLAQLLEHNPPAINELALGKVLDPTDAKPGK